MKSHHASCSDRIVRTYGTFLELTSRQYEYALTKENLRCLRGCRECCTGLFGVTMLDALYLQRSLKKVPGPIRRRVVGRADKQLSILERKGIFSREAPVLRTASAVDSLARRTAAMTCPCLENGRCLIYEYRPHLCRVFGPDVRGPRRALLSQGCGHFPKDIAEADFPILSNFADEETLLKALFRAAGRKRLVSMATVIPAALVLDLVPFLSAGATASLLRSSKSAGRP